MTMHTYRVQLVDGTVYTIAAEQMASDPEGRLTLTTRLPGVVQTVAVFAPAQWAAAVREA